MQRRTQKTVGAAAMAAAALTGGVAVGLAAAGPAHAHTVFISADHLATASYTVGLGGVVDGKPYSPLTVYESPDVFTVSIDGGTTHPILVFCVDIFHRFDSHTPPVTYFTDPVMFDSDSVDSGGGMALTPLISGEIGHLAHLGQLTADPARLAGIQGAIWNIEYPGLTISGGSSHRAAYVAVAGAWGASHPGATYTPGIYPLDAKTGGFGITQGFTGGGTPEPGVWALMLLGFGAVGAALRRRRAEATAVVV